MKIDIKINFGQKIRELRKENNLTQEELATLIGIDYKYLQKIEGKNPPNIRIETIEKFAKALKTTPNKLLPSD